MVSGQQFPHGGQHGGVIVDGQVGGQEVAELNEGVLTLKVVE